MAPKPVLSATISTNPDLYEEEHVHAVYNDIAAHFSSTRYKPWPVVAAFLKSIPTGWIGLDSGTGNGKYIALQNDSSDSTSPTSRGRRMWTIGVDRSINLLKIAQHAGLSDDRNACNEVVRGDAMNQCWRSGAFDYAISIATIHHLATLERRREAVAVILRSLSPTHGRALIYVWAIQQDEQSKRTVSNPDSDDSQAGRGQDVFVPWVFNKQIEGKNTRDGADHSVDTEGPRVYNRFYHMFDTGELRELVCEAAGSVGMHIIPHLGERQKGLSYVEIVQDGWERSNYYIEIRLSIG